MPRPPKKRDITFYLLKEEVVEFDQAVSTPERLTRYDIDLAPYQGCIFVKDQQQHAPWWLAFLRDGAPTIGNLVNANTAAALFIRTGQRTFATTFGYGRNILSLGSFERDFGLRVALNLVDPDTLRSVDARTFEELTVMTRSQTSRAAGLENFRISQAEDILKAVTGTPRDPAIGSRVTGADALKLTYAPELTELGDKCNQLLVAYQSDAYKERFGFIDQLRIERDPAKIEQLNNEIVRRIQTREFGSIHLAPPEVVDLQDIETFFYERLSEEGHEDLDIEDFRNLLGDQPIELKTFKKGRIGAQYRGAGEPHFKWSVYDCLVAEVRDGERLSVLSGGVWYHVDGDFAEQVARELEHRVGDATLLPQARSGEEEGIYNNRVAEEMGYHLLDKKLVVPTGARTSIEFCDLLCENQKLLHLKRKTRSSTLSHLFSQGVVSAEIFLRDAGFRNQLAEKLRRDGMDAAANLIPRGAVSPSEWEVVYGVIGGDARSWPRSLPFFSQLNFRMAADRLGNLGYGVSLVNVAVI